MTPRELVLSYIDALEALNFPVARSFLADEGFEYFGPNMQFTNADELLTFLFGMGPIQKGIETRRVITEGDEVCALMDYKTYFEPIGDVRVAMWVKVVGDRIQNVEVFYNAAVVENMLSVDSQNPFIPHQKK